MSNYLLNPSLRKIRLIASHDSGMSEYHNPTLGATREATVTQHGSIKHQLNAGARLFDIRPVISGGKYRTGHYSKIDYQKKANGLAEDIRSAIHAMLTVDIPVVSRIPGIGDLVRGGQRELRSLIDECSNLAKNELNRLVEEINGGHKGVTWQGAAGQSIESIVDDINTALEESRRKEEPLGVIVLRLSHARNTDASNLNYPEFNESQWNGVLEELANIEPLRPFKSGSGHTTENEALNKVIVIIGDPADDDDVGVPFDRKFQGQGGSGFYNKTDLPTCGEYTGTNDAQHMAGDQIHKMLELQSPWKEVYWTLTLSDNDSAYWAFIKLGTGIEIIPHITTRRLISSLPGSDYLSHYLPDIDIGPWTLRDLICKVHQPKAVLELNNDMVSVFAGKIRAKKKSVYRNNLRPTIPVNYPYFYNAVYFDSIRKNGDTDFVSQEFSKFYSKWRVNPG